MGTRGGPSNGPILDFHVSSIPKLGEFEKSPFLIAAKRLEMDENVSRIDR